MTTRHDLLTQAETLARRRGYDGFSFADLARRAGIRKASVHYHFPTKADLSLDLVDIYAERILAALNAVSGESASARLSRIIALYRDALEGGDSQCLCVAFSAVADQLPQETRARIGKFQSDVLDWLEGVFRDARLDGTISNPGPANEEAAAVFAQLEGAQLMARASRDPVQFDNATRNISRRLQEGDQP